jgi:hypothetical protein
MIVSTIALINQSNERTVGDSRWLYWGRGGLAQLADVMSQQRDLFETAPVGDRVYRRMKTAGGRRRPAVVRFRLLNTQPFQIDRFQTWRGTRPPMQTCCAPCKTAFATRPCRMLPKPLLQGSWPRCSTAWTRQMYGNSCHCFWQSALRFTDFFR